MDESAAILNLIERQDKTMADMEASLKEFMKVSLSLNYERIVSKLDPIEDDIADINNRDMIRNGRLEKVEKDIKEVKKQTSIIRWAHMQPIYAAILVVSLFIAMAYGYHKLTVNVLDTIENTTGIIIEESNKE